MNGCNKRDFNQVSRSGLKICLSICLQVLLAGQSAWANCPKLAGEYVGTVDGQNVRLTIKQSKMTDVDERGKPFDADPIGSIFQIGLGDEDQAQYNFYNADSVARESSFEKVVAKCKKNRLIIKSISKIRLNGRTFKDKATIIYKIGPKGRLEVTKAIASIKSTRKLLFKREKEADVTLFSKKDLIDEMSEFDSDSE